MTVDLPDFRRGARLSQIPARQWRNLVDSVRALLNATGAGGLTIDKRPSGFVYRQKQTKREREGAVAGGGIVRQARLRIVYDDYLLVDPWDAEAGAYAGGAGLKIAKPWDLQRTPWDGQAWGGIQYTYSNATSRQAVGVGINQTEIIIPRYLAGVELDFAAVEHTGVNDPTTGDELLFRDLNVAGRTWTEIE